MSRRRAIPDGELHDVAEAVRQVQTEHAMEAGDRRANTGFRAIALVALVDGTTLDVVSGRARAGGHEVDHVVSIEVRAGALIEVSQRNVAAANRR